MTGHVACDVIINQAGNSNYTAAPQYSHNVTVAAAVIPTKSLTGPSTAAYLSTYNVTPTSDSFSVPTLTATPATVCTISGTTVSMINGTGTCTVKAIVGGELHICGGHGHTRNPCGEVDEHGELVESGANHVRNAADWDATQCERDGPEQQPVTGSICVHTGGREDPDGGDADAQGEVHADGEHGLHDRASYGRDNRCEPGRHDDRDYEQFAESIDRQYNRDVRLHGNAGDLEPDHRAGYGNPDSEHR